MAGGEPRLGTTATYMRRHDHRAACLSTEIDRLHARLYSEYQVFSAASARKWSKFGLVFEAIREHGTTAAAELAAAAMTARSIPESDNAIRRDFVARFLNTFHDLLRRGTVEKIGQGRGVRWKLAEREPGLL